MTGPTIKDVAREAGVSASTVSRALAGSSVISEDTRRRVTAAAERLGYTPNTAARCLRSDSSGIIGIVVPDISGEFYAACASAVFSSARERGYAVLIADSAGSEGEDGVKTLLERRVDGIIFIGGGSDDKLISETAKKLPVVTGDRKVAGVTSVVFDDRRTVAELVTALYRDGYRSFAYVGEPTERQWSLKERYLGYLEGLLSCPDAAGGSVLDARLDGDKLRGGYEIFFEKFNEKVSGDETRKAVITSNDLIAQGIISAANEAGAAVPEELAVAGFDDSRVCAYWTPPLTSVRQDAGQLAEECLKRLFGLINKREVNDAVLRQRIIVRESMKINCEISSETRDGGLTEGEDGIL